MTNLFVVDGGVEWRVGAAATETAKGTVEHATQAEVQAGTAGNLVATAASLKAELDRRQTPEAWVAPTLLNGWVNFGGAEQVAQYRKNVDGTVTLRGVIANGTANAACFVLPAGFRPAAVERFPTYAAGVTTSCAMTVTPAGEVQPSHTASRVTLSGVRFEATQ